MSADEARTASEVEQADDIERGTYEIIRDRLLGHGSELAGKAEALNKKRLELFGGSEMTVIGSQRIRTENNCMPRDIVQVGGRLLFAYQVFLGLKKDTSVDDVLSLHDFTRTDENFLIEHASADFLTGEKFIKDFSELYRYYKDTRLIQLRHIGAKLLAVFQTGGSARDVKVFQWAVYPGGNVTYIDNRGEREHVFPPSHDFEWSSTTRDQHVAGRHPHVNILDEVFVETVGGDLTVKVEDNTEDGQGIYRELVDDADQSLGDAQIQYARIGVLILIKILPYHEDQWRHLIFNTRTRTVHRIDAIGQACVQLPEDHGLIFPGGYYLRSGETKSFTDEVENLEFIRKVASPNGEDVLYVFHNRDKGESILLPYNMIRKEVPNPIPCSGYSLFDDGTMFIFRAQEEPTRVHPMQIWQTPFTSDEFAAATPTGGSFLENVGNADLVRGISDAYSINRMIGEQQPSVQVYEDLISAATHMIDTYFWIDKEEASNLLTTLREVLTTAELIIGEFEKVEILRTEATTALAAAEDELTEVLRGLYPDRWEVIDNFVDGLTSLRTSRGRLITLRDLRYMDLARVEELEARVIDELDKLGAATIDFLTTDQALDPLHQHIVELEQQLEEVTKVAETTPLREGLTAIDDGLQMLNEIVSGLSIEDATVRTSILEGISEVLSSLNRARALIESRRRELMSGEAVAEFGAQFKVFSQTVTASLAMADTPDRCDAEMSRLMLIIEEMEGRFSEFDEFMEQLATKREEVYEALASKKQQLLDQRQRRADHMMQAAGRILDGIGRRVASLATIDELNAFFASDTMVARIRDLVDKLRELGDSVKADEIESRLKTARQDAARGQKDRKDIFEEGGAVIRLGRHRFSVNTQALDLTIVPRNGHMALHLTGTSFYELVDDPDFNATSDYWSQELVSETPEVYRGEYLAATILSDAELERDGLSINALKLAITETDGLLAVVRQASADRYDEGYERGLHDADAVLILERLLGLYTTADLLRFAPAPRAWACLFWAYYLHQMTRDQWRRRAQSLGRMRTAFAHSEAIVAFSTELAESLGSFLNEQGIPADETDVAISAAYLFEELTTDQVTFVTSAEAVALRKAFVTHLRENGSWQAFEEDLRQLQDDLMSRYQLADAWVAAFIACSKDPEITALAPTREEAVVLLLTEAAVNREVSHALTSTTVEGLLGQHPRIEGRSMSLRLDEFLGRLGAFRRERVPGYRAFQEARHCLLERERGRLRLEEYMPRVMSSFVRNRLINDVYLPLIGDNLAKQLGAVGDAKRTDLMGLLLLISPPGYGKTTIMEYLANRLGLVFMKINGPALGHSVTSLDPADAPNATARQEVEKINLAFEMGNNVLLYLDDIQHTNSELLQKFISLCDAQRRVEGVWKGKTRTYDLRGRRFCVCMAGNPYTESGERFQIPDMLANRADTYNLGDILDGKEDTFALSYLENALTSNAILAPLTTHPQEDIYKLVAMAKGEPVQSDQLSHPYSAVELGEIMAVFQKLLKVQKVLLDVNMQYIYSASQDEAFRTEPRFQLQGSYRNMAKLAEKIVPVMNDAELEALVDDHYHGEAQTLTTGAEHNLLKLAEMRGVMSDDQKQRWQEIKGAYARVKASGGADDDPVVRVTGTLGLLSDRLADISRQIETASTRLGEGASSNDLAPALEAWAGKVQETLAVVTSSQAVAATEAPVSASFDPEIVARLEGQLSHLAKGLEAIGRAIVASTKRQIAAAAEAAETAPPPAQTAPPTDLGPYLEGLNQAVASLGGRSGGVHVLQSLQPGVHDLLDEMGTNVETGLLELMRGIERRVKASGGAKDKHLKAMMNRMLKNFDMLKDLIHALRRLDTTAFITPTEEDADA